MRKFIANAYEVEIWEGGKCRSLKINDATGTFRSIELDEISDETVKAIEEYNEVLPSVQKIIHGEESDDKEAQQGMLDRFEKVSRKIKQLNAKFIKINVKDWEKNIELIDDINAHEREQLFGAIKRASLGITDNRDISKKKEQPTRSTGELKKPSSKKRASQKRK